MSNLFTQGTVTKIGVNAVNGQYGPQNQFFIELDNGVTVTCFGKKDAPNGKDASGEWAAIYPGTTISCNYTQAGQYNNTKATQITVLGQGAAPQAAPQGAPAQAASQGNAGGRPAKGINPEYAVGRWVNGAVALVQSGHVTDLQAGIKEVAKTELWAQTHFDRILEGARAALAGGATKQAPPVQQPAPVQQPPPVQQPVPQQAPPDDFDDDIPF